MRDYDKAIALNPKAADDYFSRGTIFQLKGELDSALADLSKAIELNPSDGAAYRERGIIYDAKDDNQRALADYRIADKLELNH